jgi:DNA-directed RNA polymerase subunit E'/Rpb7
MSNTFQIVRNKRTEPEQRKIYGVYIKSLLERKVSLSITEVGKNVKQNLERKTVSHTEGRCMPEGFIQPDSIHVLRYSSGTVNLDMVDFHVVYECMVCNPVEGMLIKAKCKTVTKAGIHAEVLDENGNMPVTAFIARDHHINNHLFNTVEEDMNIVVKVIGTRYELNDPYICVIAKLESIDQNAAPNKKKTRITVLEN